MRTVCLKTLLLGLTFTGLAAYVQNGQAQITSLVGTDTTWRYNTNGVDLGTAWRTNDYDDSVVNGWDGPGQMLFGFETTPDEYLPLIFRTQFADPVAAYNVSPPNYVITYYFRTHFSANTNTPYLNKATLVSSNWIDDGAVIYLNGVEAARIRATNAAAVPIQYRDLFTGPPAEGYTTAQAQTVTNLSLANLRQGDNVLAIEVHQSTTNSSDIVMGSTLTFDVPVPLAITSQPQSTNVVVGFPAAFSVGVSGSHPVYRWYKNNAIIASATNSSYTIASVTTNDAGSYYVVVTNILGRLTSAPPAVLTVLPRTFGPRVVSAVVTAIGGVSNAVLLNFDDQICRDSATNLSSYRINLGETTTTLAITNVAAASCQASNAVRLRTSTVFVQSNSYILTIQGLASCPCSNPKSMEPARIGISFNGTTNIMSCNQGWLYWDSGNEFMGWKDTNYDDSFWASGSPLFYGPSIYPGSCPGCPQGRLVDFTATNYYYRTWFYFPTNVPTNATLRLRHFVDDGAVFYLNGVEMLRYNMPAYPTVITGATRATTGAGSCVTVNLGNTPAGTPISSLLRVGRTNLLAVEVHQNETPGPNSDTAFSAELDADFLITPLVSPLPRLFQSLQSSKLTLMWTNAPGFALESATNPAGPWAQVSGAASGYMAMATNRATFYRLHK